MEHKNKCKITIDLASFELAINFLLDQCFLSVENFILCHVIGTPMSSDPTLFMENLFRYDCENNWFLSTKKLNLVNAKELCHVFRFSIIFVPLKIIPSLKRKN